MSDNVPEQINAEQIAEQSQGQTANSADAIALVSDKWVVEVLHAIRAGHNRYGSMLRHIPEITRKMLTQTLRKLERNGILNRVDYQEQPPRVEYSITSAGDALVSHLTQMCQWSQTYFDDVERARQTYDSNNDGWV
ncbi:MAG: helix-turn-helix domain-containing protein [Aggregatilineales bacterium]